MKQFDLETYNRLVSEGETPKVVTREGLDVRILCTDRKGVRPIIAVDDNEVNYTEHVSESFMKLLERNVWADDGQPCGVKEE